MLVKFLGKRERIDTEPHDPARLAAILEQWSPMMSAAMAA
jgi:hypothetical protein